MSAERGERVAAIDCGTNSTRLLVAEAGPDGRLVVLERLMHITRLGQGVDRTGSLAGEAIERTLAVLRDFRTVMDGHGVARVRMTATSAARDAANREQFFAPAAEVVGAPAELLTGEDEAHLSFIGATAELDAAQGPFLVIDLGGGSTEFVYGTEQVDAAISVDVGCVRMTERFLEHDPPQPEELVAAISLTDTYVDDVVLAIGEATAARTFVGLAGTITAVAAVEIGLPAFDPAQVHHFVLTRAAIEDVFRTLATESHDDRLANPGLEPERADVIVGGCCVLVSIVRRLGIDEMLVSEADILDGLALSLLRSGDVPRPAT